MTEVSFYLYVNALIGSVGVDHLHPAIPLRLASSKRTRILEPFKVTHFNHPKQKHTLGWLLLGGVPLAVSAPLDRRRQASTCQNIRSLF